jgi:tRNA threonylcarbamoyladenosine biosynthesis protein TsaB
MKILGIESSSVAASCAVSENNILLGEYTLCHRKTHSEKLMPLIEKLIGDLGLDVHDLDVVAVSEGPGSYTGLRIGAAIAKSIAFAIEKPIAAVPTMKSMASNLYISDKYIVPIMDAKAGRVYTGVYSWENERLTTVREQFPCNIEELAEILNSYSCSFILNGDGSENYRNLLDEKLKVDHMFSPKQFSGLKASSLLKIGYEMALSGELISPAEFAPKYLRLSQAERNKK